jgi:hypothetical protein
MNQLFDIDKHSIDVDKQHALSLLNFTVLKDSKSLSKLFEVYSSLNSEIMIIKLISGALILFSCYMGISHGRGGLNIKASDRGAQADLIRKINMSQPQMKFFSILTILGGVLILAPQTFLAGNILNAALFLFLIVRFLMVQELKPALIEIPFMLIPLILIYLRHPFSAR